MYSSVFLQRAEKTFEDLMVFLDTLPLSWEGHEKSLSITMGDGKVYALHRHDFLEEIWLSSPHSGGYHYGFDESSQGWYCKKNKTFFPGFLQEEWKEYYNF